MSKPSEETPDLSFWLSAEGRAVLARTLDRIRRRQSELRELRTGMHSVKPGLLTNLNPDAIKIGNRFRLLNPGFVHRLALSIYLHGQKQPISVALEEYGGGYRLIAGWHRLESIKLLEAEELEKAPTVWAGVYEGLSLAERKINGAKRPPRRLPVNAGRAGRNGKGIHPAR
jgi:hypothetical protein